MAFTPKRGGKEAQSASRSNGIGKDSLKIKELEHVLIEKGGQLFWNLL